MADGDVRPQGRKDVPTVDADGRRRSTGIEGVRVSRAVVHADHRGSLAELYNPDDAFWRGEPAVYAYLVRISPGRIKGWGMHRVQADRYATVSGSLRVVLYDGRVGSETHGRFAQFYFDDATTGFLHIPPGVWHADQNYGRDDVVLVNFPTHPYDRDDPDKYRIDVASDEIPFDFALRDG